MTDPLSTAASAVSIADRAAAVFRWLRGRAGQPPSQAPLLPPGHRLWDFEVLPIRFELWLAQQVPSVDVSLYVVNYLKHSISIREGKVALLSIGGAVGLENIPLAHEWEVPRGKATFVICRRTLMDSEARALLACNDSSVRNSSVSLIARARAGKREYQYGPVSSIVIGGFANRPSA